jgi:thiol-disulfide isomerase/thioredoxin
MNCPKCGWEQAAELECDRCGLVLSKHRAPRESATATSSLAVHADAGARGALRAPLAILAFGMAGLWSLWRVTEPPPAAPPPPRVVPAPAPTFEPVTPAGRTEAPPVESTFAQETATPAPTVEEVQAKCPLLDGTPPHAAAMVSSGWRDGSSGFEDGQSEQVRTKAPLMVYFFADWCQYCRAFERDVLFRGEVERELRAIKVRVNAEASPAEKALARRFGVRRYPEVFLLLPGGATSLSIPRYGEHYDANGFVRSVGRGVSDYALMMVGRARQHRANGDLGDALASLDVAAALAPDVTETYTERGSVYVERGDPVLALDDFCTAYAIGLRDPITVITPTVTLLERAGRRAEAAACRKLTPHASEAR